MDTFADGEFLEGRQSIAEVIKLSGEKLSLQLVCVKKMCEPAAHCQEGTNTRDSMNQLDVKGNKRGNWDTELVSELLN